jgi:hypothetical protein
MSVRKLQYRYTPHAPTSDTIMSPRAESVRLDVMVNNVSTQARLCGWYNCESKGGTNTYRSDSHSLFVLRNFIVANSSFCLAIR